MAVASASRWRRYGKDRVYVTAADGTKLGFFDLQTGLPQQVPALRSAEFDDAIVRWRRANPTVTVPAAASPAETASAASATTAAPASRSRSSPRPTPAPRQASRPSEQAPAGPQEWVDLAANPPGQAAAQVAAAYREARPVATRLARLLGRHTDERAWRAGADGEVETARRLLALTDPSPWQFSHVGLWRVLHSVPVGERGSDIDHVVIGAPGVFVVNSKHHRGKLVTTTPRAVVVGKHPTRYAEFARTEADRTATLLAAALRWPRVLGHAGAQHRRRGRDRR